MGATGGLSTSAYGVHVRAACQAGKPWTVNISGSVGRAKSTTACPAVQVKVAQGVKQEARAIWHGTAFQRGANCTRPLCRTAILMAAERVDHGATAVSQAARFSIAVQAVPPPVPYRHPHLHSKVRPP